MNPTVGGAASLCVSQLTVALPSGRRLLQRASVTIAAGDFVLLVGPSGAGKTTLLKLIAGIGSLDDDLNVSGRIEVDVPGGDGSDPRIGLVFQEHALFDELSAEANVRFAIDHRPGGAANAQEQAIRLLQRLRVPLSTLLSRLSGGERQRVAVARSIAMNPSVLMFDEPTTGLDPCRVRDTIALIAEMQLQARTTIIIVTHDFEPFLPHRPRLILLDPDDGKLHEVDEAGLRAFFDRTGASQAPSAREHQPGDTPKRRGARRWTPWVESPGRALLTLLKSPLAAAAGWRHAVWKLRYLWYYGRLVALGTTTLYAAMAGIMLGFVFLSFGFGRLPYTEVTVPLVTEELLAATGYSTYRVIVPLLVSVLVASKCGAAVAADVGTRRLTHQFEAMRSLGADPEAYLYGNAAIALTLAVPFLTLVAFAFNSFASLIAYLLTSPDTTIAVFVRNFFSTLWPTSAWLPKGTGWVVLKAATSGLLIASLAYAIGSRRKDSPVDVSRDVSLTIFWASLGVLSLHSLYSFVEF